MTWQWHLEKSKDAIAIYRVSSKGQENTTSLPFQESQIQQYSIECALDIKKTFRLAESAKDSDNRKGYQEAIAYALKNKIKHIIFYMGDRETRNMTDIENNNKHIKAGRIVIHHTAARRVYWEGSSPADFMVRNVEAASSQYYVDVLSVKIRGGQKGKAEMGWYPYAKLPAGYMWQRELNEDGREYRRGVAKILPDTNLDRLLRVRKEFEFRAEGLSSESIREKIIEMGLKPSKGEYKASNIEKRLKNKFYWGYFDYKGSELKGLHPLIIPQHILDKVAASYKMSFGWKKNGNPDALLAGWIRCGHPDCGMTLVYDAKPHMDRRTGKCHVDPITGEKRLYRYYRCTNAKLIHENKKGLTITEDKIFEQLTSVVRDITISSQRAYEIMEQLKIEEQGEAEERKKLAHTSKRSIQEVSQREVQAYRDFSAGILNRDVYATISEDLKEERERIQRQLHRLTTCDSTSVIEYANKVIQTCNGAETLWKSASRARRAELVKELVSKPTFHEGTLRFELEKSYELIAEISKGTLKWTFAPELRTFFLQHDTPLVSQIKALMYA